jgi:imidazolonepropionase-like amidohydrolase
MNKRLLKATPGALLALVGLGLLGLTSSGMVSFRTPYANSVAVPVEAPPVAFAHVSVIPMDRERVIEGQTVLVRNGLIEAIGPAESVALPADSLVVDGRGRYLMPGLVDMHVHIKYEDDLLLYVANGVTAVRDMWGTTGMQLMMGFPDQLELRQRIHQGQLLGPALYLAGPIMESEPTGMPFMTLIRTPAEAVESVAWQREQGYDFVKVYDNLTPEIYTAITHAAREHGLPVIGHVPWQVGLEGALAAGQLTIEHLTGYVDHDAAEFVVPEELLAEYARRTAAAGVWNSPTLGIYPLLGLDTRDSRLDQQPGMAYVPPRFRFLWRLFHSRMKQNITYEGPDYAARIAAVNGQMVKLLHDNGARLILGTDAGNPYLVPGFSLHRELQLMVEAGLSPYEALRAGTVNAATALGQEGVFGSVAVGRQADLLLLEANPLDNVSHAARRSGVMLRGQWFPEAQLQQMLNEMQATYNHTWWERFWPLFVIVAGVFLALTPWHRRFTP